MSKSLSHSIKFMRVTFKSVLPGQTLANSFAVKCEQSNVHPSEFTSDQIITAKKIQRQVFKEGYKRKENVFASRSLSTAASS